MSRSNLPYVALAAPRGFSCDVPKRVLSRWDSALAARDDGGTISILDPIGSDLFGEGVTAKSIAAALRSIGERDVVVNINSPGGDVFEGIAIYNIVRAHPGRVTVRIIGLAASAASVVAMAGDRIEIARSGFIMMHNVWVVMSGNRNDLRDAADLLEPFDEALAGIYAARSGLDKKAVAKLMDSETWLGGEQAIEQGFADGLLPEDENDTPSSLFSSMLGADEATAAMERIHSLLNSYQLI